MHPFPGVLPLWSSLTFLDPNEWPFAVQAIRADFQYLDAHHQLAIAIGVQLVNKAHERMTASYGAVLQHPGQLEITKNQPEIVILEDYLRLLSLLQSYRTDFVSAAGRLGAAKLSAGFALGHDSLNYIWNLQNQVSGCLAQDQARVHRAQAQLTKAKTKAELRDTFLTSHFSIPGAWRGVKLFDEGANTAGLFVLHDEHDTIIERVVKKSEVCDNASWPKRFDNFPHNPRFREGWLTEKCADAASSHFVGYRGHDYDVPKRIVSLYTNYCPFGDLWGILSVDRMRFQVPVPEPFLWAAFIQLVEACKVMRDGMLEEGHVVGWKHIIHRKLLRSWPSPRSQSCSSASAALNMDLANIVGFYRRRYQAGQHLSRLAFGKSLQAISHTEVGAFLTVIFARCTKP